MLICTLTKVCVLFQRNINFVKVKSNCVIQYTSFDQAVPCCKHVLFQSDTSSYAKIIKTNAIQ